MERDIALAAETGAALHLTHISTAPSLEAVAAVCNIVRESEVAGFRLWRYLRIEARVGRPLFFGNA